MKSLFNNADVLINEIRITGRDSAELIGFAPGANTYDQTLFHCGRTDVFDMLKQSGKELNLLTCDVEAELTLPHSSPFLINLIEKLGHTQVINTTGYDLLEKQTVNRTNPKNHIREMYLQPSF